MNKKPAKIKYPKFLLLLLTFILAYLIFTGRDFSAFNNFVLSSGYFGTFVSGILFTYGFTAAPATAVFLILAKGQNILISGLIGGLGALVGDMIIFRFIRHSFADEIEKLSQEKVINHINNKMPNLLKKYLVPVLAGFIIASPLPDEIGVSLMAVSRSISTKIFYILSYTLNTAGIFVILFIGKAIN